MIRRSQPLRRSSKFLKRSRPRKQRKTTVASLKRKLWKLFSAYVLERDKRVCFTCGNVADQAGHFYSTRIASTWIDPRNVHAQCARCNLYLHGNPGMYAERIRLDYGQDELERLSKRATQVIKQWRADELETFIEALKRGGADFEMAYYEGNL